MVCASLVFHPLKLLVKRNVHRFELKAAPYGYMEKYNYKLLNANGKNYRGLYPNEQRGPFTLTEYKGVFRGSEGNLIRRENRNHLRG